jgi:uncharacterized protein
MVYKIKIESTNYFFDGESMSLYKDKIIPNNTIGQKQICSEEGTIEKVTINVANECYGDCVYCYQVGSDFGRNTGLMNLEVAEKVTTFLIEKYNNIGQVSFFGGEPTLNFNAIELIVTKLLTNGLSPKFDITTNASNISEKFIELFLKYNFKVIISIDGPSEIHNILRTNCRFDNVISVIERLKKTEISSKLELNCTLTKYHLENIGYDKLILFFEKLGVKYKITNVITELEWLKLPTVRSSVEESICLSLDYLSMGHLNKGVNGYLSNIIMGLVHQKHNEYFCSELCSNGGIVIGYEGTVHKCIKLYNKTEITEADIYQINKKNHDNCISCWAKGICTDCTAAVLIKEKKAAYDYQNCEKKYYYSYALEKLVRILHSDTKKFQDIIDNFCG